MRLSFKQKLELVVSGKAKVDYCPFKKYLLVLESGEQVSLSRDVYKFLGRITSETTVKIEKSCTCDSMVARYQSGGAAVSFKFKA